uniref:uncharacterized protein LOC120331323 n=1 Tax=Styela clava TaxID=7725 RepID=UPI00193A703D|nr:uncharacterized protein LOC120331323 [Styela clava]XP_039254331.1 uncharacterized protein LOC120331324 [Styela clava]
MQLPVLFLVSVFSLLSPNSSAKQIRRHIYGPSKDGEYCQKDYFETAKGWLEERYCKKCRRGYENNDTEHSNTCTKIKTKPTTQSPKGKNITGKQKPIKEQNCIVSNLMSTPTTNVYEQTKKVPSSPKTQTTTPSRISHDVENHEFKKKTTPRILQRKLTSCAKPKPLMLLLTFAL